MVNSMKGQGLAGFSVPKSTAKFARTVIRFDTELADKDQRLLGDSSRTIILSQLVAFALTDEARSKGKEEML
jgi:hypothetical protein